MVALFVLEGLGDEARRVPVLPAPEGNPVHLQDHLTHPQLAAVVGRPTPLVERETRENESNTVSLKQRFQSSRFYIETATTQRENIGFTFSRRFYQSKQSKLEPNRIEPQNAE